MATTPTGPVQADSGPGSSTLRRAQGVLRKSARVLGLVLLTFVAWVFVRSFADPYGYRSVDPAVVLAVGLVGAGVLLLRGQEPVAADAERAATAPKVRSPLGILTLSVASLVVGTLILVGNLGVATVTIGQLAAAALTVVALGLVLGAWWGRSRFLLVVGAVLVPFVVAGGSMHFPLRGSLGDRSYQASSIDDVPASYEILLGSLHVNLADMRDFTGEREIDVDVAAGNVTIFVPDRIGLTITGGIEWGNATIGRGREQGEDLAFDTTVPGRPGAGHLTIDFSGGIASLYVERFSYADLHGRHPQPRPERPDRSHKRPERQRGKGDGRRDRAQT